MMYMSDERRRDASKRAGPFGMPSGEPPCGVASRFLGITQVRVSRLEPRPRGRAAWVRDGVTWRFDGRHHSDAMSVNRP